MILLRYKKYIGILNISQKLKWSNEIFVKNKEYWWNTEQLPFTTKILL